MANPKNNAPVVPEEEKVDLYIPRGTAKNDHNLFIGVNGVNYILPKGQTSKVPKFVADEYRRSQNAETAQSANIDNMKIKPEQK